MSSQTPCVVVDTKGLITRTERLPGESAEHWLQRALKKVVLAHTQAQVARKMGIKQENVAKPLRHDVKPQLGTICRIADAVDCDLILVAREAHTPCHAPHE